MNSEAESGILSSLTLHGVDLIRVAAGLCEPPPADVHRLSVNTGTAVWGTCCSPGRPRRYLRSAGGINFVPAGASMGWVLDSPATLLKMSVPHSLIRTAAEDLDLDARALDFRIAVQRRETQIEWLARTLRAEAAAGNPNGLLFRESLGLALAIVLVRKFAGSSPSPSVQNARFTPLQLKRITDYVESNLNRQDLSLRQLSAVAGISVTHFKSLFKRSTGVSAHRFVVQRRVERAAVLLRFGRSSISDIAAEMGFAHASHLARWTHRLLGVNPSDLRRRGKHAR